MSTIVDKVYAYNNNLLYLINKIKHILSIFLKQFQKNVTSPKPRKLSRDIWDIQ